MVTSLGFVGLMLAVLAGFEEPPAALVWLSGVLLLAAPASVVSHLWLTRRLSRDEKRVWARALAGPHAPQAFSLYLTAADRRVAIATLNRQARERRHHPNG